MAHIKEILITAALVTGCRSPEDLSSSFFGESSQRGEHVRIDKVSNQIDLSKVILYSGAGVSERSLIEIPDTMQSTFGDPKYKLHIESVGPEIFDSPNFGQDTSLLIIPGGADLPYVQDLQGKRNEAIRNYIMSGGRVLGLCAGAYYLSKYVEFDKGGPLEVEGSRELVCFPGTARGPVFGPYHVGSDEGGRAVGLIWTGPEKPPANLTTYFDGGCEFVDADKFPNVTVLARYKDVPGNPAAIVEIKIGLGKVILSGVHPDLNLQSAPLRSSNAASIHSAIDPNNHWLLSTLISRLF